MNVINHNSINIIVQFDIEEIIIINNSLNEVCNALDIHEFDTRIGTSIDKVRVLLGIFSNIITEHNK